MNRCVKRNIDQRCERDREIARSKKKRTNPLQLRQGKCFFMLDVTTVGSELAPAQQDSTLADLLFFLDQFGSTRAVRIKLHEQQKDDEHVAHAVGETTTDLDFFIKTYGSDGSQYGRNWRSRDTNCEPTEHIAVV
ncbi:hypothetical protein F443_12219 [Phytophthora nicotianae P1569]|uniref:Uncharacterized protein n=1 Tax=Phytophthora nicotianae P1569 TaxID=1317065 RepID=V9EX67_PHYNI|nr:hypothetical protein F443_12219 [Phytophthora nicotianae P1569]